MYPITTPDSFKWELVENANNVIRPVGNPGGKYKRRYKDLWCAFDIETSTLKPCPGSADPQSFMYLFGFQIGDNNPTIIGRDWADFVQVLSYIDSCLGGDETLVVFVHNLSFEFQYLAGVIEFDEGSVFSMGNRAVLRCTTCGGKVEFRCSRMQTNRTLRQFLRDMGVPVQKEELDYSEVRYPWTKLSDETISYQVADVLGLVQAMKKQAELDGDNLYTLPLTSTGYCRRDVKDAIKNAKGKNGKPWLRHFLLEPMMPDLPLYKRLREAFRGGDVHASRFYTGSVVYNVNSYDRSSSYPDVMVNCEFPMTPFQRICDADCTPDVLNRLLKKHRALLITVYITGLRLKNRFCPNPYLSLAKLQGYGSKDEYEIDNGRVLRCDKCLMTVTDIDWWIILDEYTWDDFRVVEMWSSHYMMLPDVIRDVVRNYYTQKTLLKPQAGDPPDQKIRYDKYKAKINALYGMSAQDPGRLREVWDCAQKAFIDGDETVIDLLEKSAKTAVLPYQIGVWVTAHARHELFLGYKSVPASSWVYSDTDSLKFVGKGNFEKLNKRLRNRSLENGAFADDRKGKRHYMGVYECETPVPYDAFATLGAKKYVYEENGQLHITIAGVPKAGGADELKRKGGIDRFCDAADDAKPLVFSECGKKCIIYNDVPDVTGVKIDGHWLPITRNVVIQETTYKLSLSEEYDALIDAISETMGVDAEAWEDDVE